MTFEYGNENENVEHELDTAKRMFVERMYYEAQKQRQALEIKTLQFAAMNRKLSTEDHQRLQALKLPLQMEKVKNVETVDDLMNLTLDDLL